jgi:hypothetical protein
VQSDLNVSQLPRPWSSEAINSKAGQIIVGGVLGAFLGAVVSSKPAVAVLLVGAVFGAITVVAAFTHPGPVFGVVVLSMALIPTYAAPGVGPILFIPAAALCWTIVAVLAWRNAIQRGHIFHPTPIDFAVIAFFALLYVSLSFSAQVTMNEYMNNAFTWAGPFLAARLLLQDVERPAFWVAASFAAATVVVAPIALLEYMGQSNPFTSLQFNSVEAAVWAAPASRLGQVRAEASFGHPIALSMFVACSAVLSLGMAIYSSREKERYIWLGLAAIGVGVQALTVSRTGWLIIVFGVFLLAVTTALRAARRRLAGIFVVVGLALFLLMASGAAPKELNVIPSTGGASEEAASYRDSGAYREALLERAVQPGVLGLWGNPVNKVTPAVSSTNTATDNAYIILADSWGLIPTFALFGVALALLISIALSRRRDMREMVIMPIAALTALGALFFVAFITQQQLMVWILIGAASAGSERALRRLREAGPARHGN